MFFSYQYTAQQQRFRDEFKDWIREFIPDADTLQKPNRMIDVEKKQMIRRDLGKKGWLAPTDPERLGGAGLSSNHRIVIREELNRLGLHSLLCDEAATLRSAILALDGESYAKQFIHPLAQGELTVWKQILNDSHLTDTINVDFTVTPDADGYIVDGKSSFSSCAETPSLIWMVGLMDTVSQEPPEYLSFVLPTNLDGICISDSRRFAAHTNQIITFTKVWVPRFHLLGSEGNGLDLIKKQVPFDTQADLPTSLEFETDALLNYARATQKPGSPLSDDPVRQQMLVEAYISSRIMRLFRMRSASVHQIETQEGYEIAESALWEAKASTQLVNTTHDVIGIFAMLDSSDPHAPDGGRFEKFQRKNLGARDSASETNTYTKIASKILGLDSRSSIPQKKLP